MLSFLREVVFKSPVRSGLLTLRGMDRDQDRSTITIKGRKTGPDRPRPVFCGLLRSWTGLFGLFVREDIVAYYFTQIVSPYPTKSVSNLIYYALSREIQKFDVQHLRFLPFILFLSQFSPDLDENYIKF